MNITQAAIEKNRITIIALLVILLGGMSAYKSMSRAEDPGFIIRTALILTYFPGAAPDRVENLVTDKLEEGIQEMPELDFVNSQSKTGISIVYVNIRESYRDMRPIWDDLRRKVDDIKPDLPEGTIGPFVNDDFGDVFGIILGLTGEGYTAAELKDVADDVRDQILRLHDAAKVDIYGAQEERIFVEYNNARLAELGLSPIQLQQILESRNIIIPGGDIIVGTERIVLEPSGNFESLNDVRRTVINVPGRKEVLYLEDLASITRGYIDPPKNKMRSSGVSCLGLAVSMRDGGDIIRLGEEVKALVERLQRAYPLGVEFDLIAFQPEHVDKKVKNFMSNLLQAVGIVLIIMLIFLGFRTGLVVASLVPMAMVMSLLVMSFLGIGLDQMSLASLIIALGMLVDNAIVMAESIMVQMREGKAPVQAAVDSAKELRLPLIISSLTTAAAFLPIYLSESSTGEYTAPLFKVVTITLLCSWLLSITMTPLFCVRFLKVKSNPEKTGYDSPFYTGYRKFLLRMLRHRFISLAVVLIIFIVVMAGMGFVPKIFFPENDKAVFTGEFELPASTSIEQTEAVIDEIDRFIAGHLAVNSEHPEGVTNWATFIGQGAPRFYLSFNPEPANPAYAVMILNATSRNVISGELIPGLEAYCLERFPDLEVTLNPLQLGPPIESPVQVRLSGSDADVLFEIAEKIRTKLGTVPGTKNISDDWGARTKKLVVKVNQPRARRSGVTSLDIAVSLQTVLSGIETTQFREANEIIPVTLRSVAADRQDIGKLESLNVYAQATGQSVPLLQVADVDVVWQPSKILRRNRLKTVKISSDLAPGVTAMEVINQVVPWLDEEKKRWDIGYGYELGGEIETSVKANQAIGEKLPIAGLIIVLLLVGQFNSIRRPLIILFTIPLGLIGVVIGLLIARSYFGFMTLLGIISLAGIVINNAMVCIAGQN